MKTITALISCFLFPSCGLISIPHKVSLPSERIRSVKVMDVNTKRTIKNCSVKYEIYKDVNWKRFNSEENMVQLLEPSVGSNGLLSFTEVKKTDKTQLWFPLGLSLGGVLEHYHFGILKVSAPEYKSIGINDPESSLYEEMHEQRQFYIEEEGVMKVYLKKR